MYNYNECIFFRCIIPMLFLCPEDLVAQTLSNIKYSTDVEATVADNCDLLIEAIVENLSVKQKMFAHLAKRLVIIIMGSLLFGVFHKE